MHYTVNHCAQSHSSSLLVFQGSGSHLCLVVQHHEVERYAEKKAPRRPLHDTMCESILINSATISLSAV